MVPLNPDWTVVATPPGVKLTIDEKIIVSSTVALALGKAPKTLVVIGAGVSGLAGDPAYPADPPKVPPLPPLPMGRRSTSTTAVT